MVKISLAVEPSLAYHEASYGLSRLGPRYIADVVGHAACDIAETLGVAAIVVPTATGESAREVSKHRPRRPIVAVSPSPSALRQLALDWAVVPLLLDEASGIEELWSKATEAVVRAGLAGPGDRVVLTSGTRVGRPGRDELDPRAGPGTLGRARAGAARSAGTASCQTESVSRSRSGMRRAARVQPGIHQLASPSSRIRAGTSRARMTVASKMMPAARPIASDLIS